MRQRLISWLVCLLLMSTTGPAMARVAVPGLTPMDSPAPGFDLVDIQGERHRLADYRGRVVIVNFWATWCPPCIAELPSMQRAWEQLRPEGILLLGINVGEDRKTIEAFDQKHPVDFPLLVDADSTASDDWPIRGMPTTFVVDGQGRVAYVAIGAREWDSPVLLDAVRALQAP